ncbi:MAG TPA: tetratricopeptide repeat protein, partial [Myxococcota bacterium]|nr:tetratricopeptide repeat protein [Myxococcota bacterium]
LGLALASAVLLAAPAAMGAVEEAADAVPTDQLEAYLRREPASEQADDTAFEIARRAARAGRPERAARYLEWAVRAHPDGDQADRIRLLLAEIEARRGRVENAREAASRIRTAQLTSSEQSRLRRLERVLAGEQPPSYLVDPRSIPAVGEPVRLPPAAAATAAGGRSRGRVGTPALETELERLRATVAELKESHDAKDVEMASLRASLEELRAGLDELREARPKRGEVAPSAGLSAAETPGEGEPVPLRATPGPAPAPAAQETVGKTKEKARRRQVQREILERQGGVLLPQGQIVLEPRLQYSNTNRNILEISGFSLIPAIIIGRLNIADVDRDVYGASLGFRYGITDWIEFELNVPYLYRVDIVEITETDDPSRDRTADWGLGDVNAGLFVHLLRETRLRPDVILNLRAKSRTGQDPFEIDADEIATGTGTWGASLGLTFVKTVDPAVLFFSTNYFAGFGRHLDAGDFDPGDTFEYSMGLAFSLNERIAMTTSLQHRITSRSKLDGDKILRSDANSATLFIGASYRMNQWTSFNVSLGIGVSEDAPDFLLELRMPWRLPYRVTFPDLASLRLPRLSLPRLADLGLPFSERRDDDAPVVLLGKAPGGAPLHP